MIRHKYRVILICSIFLLFPGTIKAKGDDYIKNIEMTDSAIKIDRQDFPHIAYLYITLKNNGDKKVSNVSFEIGYYGEGGYLIKRVTVKDALNDIIPGGETRKYKVRLNGDVVNVRNEQYPYSQGDVVAEFNIKITNVKFASR